MQTALAVQQAVADLQFRLRAAATEYHDVRYILSYGFPPGLWWTICGINCGEHFEQLIFWLRPEEGELFWNLGLYRDSKRPSPHDINLGRRQNVEQEDESGWLVAYRNRLQSLEADCLHLAAAAGVLSLPGLPQLHSGLVPWLWLVFHVAWERPQGSLLRAARWFPEVELRRTAATLKREPSGDSEGLLADVKAFLATPGGRYCSVLPHDPFTASAAMFDLASAVSPGRAFGENAEPIDGKTVALALPQVNLDANQVRYRGRCYDVSADGALLFCKLVESHPQAISASTLFSKPSRVKASLPDALQAIVVVEPAKGYRLKLD